eukprot:jgi/Botrbrau1/18739/Bobra.0386s0062.1
MVGFGRSFCPTLCRDPKTSNTNVFDKSLSVWFNFYLSKKCEVEICLTRMQEGFEEFLRRPENKKLLEKAQKKEMKQALRLAEQSRLVDLQEKVLEADYDVQKKIAPYLANPVLRRIIQTFTNDEHGDFGKWASNPMVLQMLQQAKELMDSGHLSERELEQALIAQLQEPGTPGHADFMRSVRPKVTLPTDQLVNALNEQLQERYKGNEYYKAGKFQEAMQHYCRAEAIINFVSGASPSDQDEVDVNRFFVYLNIAAACMGLRQYGQAVTYSTKALDLQPQNAKALMRRAKAYMYLHEYANAESDIRRVQSLQPELQQQVDALKRLSSILHGMCAARVEPQEFFTDGSIRLRPGLPGPGYLTEFGSFSLNSAFRRCRSLHTLLDYNYQSTLINTEMGP